MKNNTAIPDGGPATARPDSRSAAVVRFALGSVFGLLFLGFFVYVFIIATRGPDEIGSRDVSGQPLGPLNTAGQLIDLRGPGKRPQNGQAAPDFALASINGKYIRLKDLRGKVVLLNFWATWCGPCQDEAKDLQKAYVTHKDSDNFVIVGVDHEETTDDIKSFFQKYALNYPVALDSDGKVAGFYGVTEYPESYFIDKNGIVRTNVFYGQMSYETIESGIEAAKQAGGT